MQEYSGPRTFRGRPPASFERQLERNLALGDREGTDYAFPDRDIDTVVAKLDTMDAQAQGRRAARRSERTPRARNLMRALRRGRN